MKRLLASAGLGLAVLGGAALAQEDTAEPPGFALRGAVPATVRANPLPGSIRLGRDTLWLEQDKLKAWGQKLGVLVRSRGTGASTLNWVCVTQEAAGTRTWLTADDFAEGVLVDGLVWAQVPSVKAIPACPAAPANWTPALPNGLKLGMTTAELTAKLGAPSYQKDGLLGFVHIRRTVTRDDVPATVNASVWAQVTGGKVVLISLGQNTSNGGGGGNAF